MDLDILRQVKAVISDVDGVMTSGQITVGMHDETKVFNVRDGLGIRLLQKGGLDFAILSGRKSAPVEKRAAELDIAVVKTGRIDKQTAFREILAELGLRASQTVYIGDDLPDLAPLSMAAMGFCPNDAVAEVCEAAHRVPVAGGRGVVRFVAEAVLKAQGRWAGMVTAFEERQEM